MKGEINSVTIIGGTVTPHFHQWTDHPDTISKGTQTLNVTLDQINSVQFSSVQSLRPDRLN